jgi:hypothetical protein
MSVSSVVLFVTRLRDMGLQNVAMKCGLFMPTKFRRNIYRSHERLTSRA